MNIKFTLTTAKEVDLFYDALLYELPKLEKAIKKYNKDNEDIFYAEFCDETEYIGTMVIKEYYVNYYRCKLEERIENEFITDENIENLIYQIGNNIAARINPNYDCDY